MKKTLFAAAATFCMSTVPVYAAPEVEAAQGQAPTVVACLVTGNDARNNDTLYQIVDTGASMDQSCRPVSMQELIDRGLVIAHGVDGQARFEFKR